MVIPQPLLDLSDFGKSCHFNAIRIKYRMFLLPHERAK